MDKQKIIVLKRKENGIKTVLLKPEEKIEVSIKKKELTAPVEEGEGVGKIVYYIQGEKWLEEEMYCDEKIEKIDFKWCVEKILKKIIKCQ